MTFRHVPLALVVAIFWVSQKPPLRAQSWRLIKVPYRAQPCDGRSAERAIRISYKEAFTNAVSMPRWIHSTRPENGRVDIKVVVTPDGTVASATPSSRNEQWHEKAVALAMSWRFVPFQREGRSVYASFPFPVRIVPPEKRPEERTSFPEINDWNSLRIILQRTGCYGATKVSRGHVSAEAVRQLVNLFRIADYFNLNDQYFAMASDAPAFTTSISFDNKSKSVVDYLGVEAGMPEVVRAVEDGIDLLAGPKVWDERQKRAPHVGK